MHSSPHVLIIAMVCCMVYQPHISTSYNVFRTVLPNLFCSLSRFCHITPTLFSLHWLPVCFRTEFKSLILAFKAIHGLAPQYITDLINVKQQFGRMMLRSQSKLQLLPPRTITKKTLGDRSFMASAPKLWNRLPSNIRAVNAPNCFKILLKTHLFRQAFSCLLL